MFLFLMFLDVIFLTFMRQKIIAEKLNHFHIAFSYRNHYDIFIASDLSQLLFQQLSSRLQQVVRRQKILTLDVDEKN